LEDKTPVFLRLAGEKGDFGLGRTLPGTAWTRLKVHRDVPSSIRKEDVYSICYDLIRSFPYKNKVTKEELEEMRHLEAEP